MSETIESFNTYLQPSDEKEIFSIKEAFSSSFDLVYKLLESQNILCNINIIEDSFVKGIKKEFVQALLVLLNNAKDVLVERDINHREINISIYKEKINLY